ncbi:MAG: cation-transporting P-type ATPase, partial [Clostridia bacterium]|nr:cation-transporting P-type ATPase [Clostridia bacterium]
MEYYKLTIQETLNEVKSGIEGLSTDEATSRLAKNGKNALAAKKKTSAFKRLLKQLADPMILILLIAAIVSLALTLVNNLNPANENESFADVIIIAIVVILNAVLGVIQESKAEKAL